MKGAWKSILTGALVGALGGLAIFLLRNSSASVTDVSRKVRETAPDAADRLREAVTQGAAAVSQGAAAVQSSDVPDRVREVAQKLGATDLSPGRDAVGKVVAKGKDLAGAVQGAELPDVARKVVDMAVDKGKEAVQTVR